MSGDHNTDYRGEPFHWTDHLRAWLLGKPGNVMPTEVGEPRYSRAELVWQWARERVEARWARERETEATRAAALAEYRQALRDAARSDPTP